MSGQFFSFNTLFFSFILVMYPGGQTAFFYIPSYPDTRYFQNILDKTMKLPYLLKYLYRAILHVFFLLTPILLWGNTLPANCFFLGPYPLLLDCFEHFPASPTSTTPTASFHVAAGVSMGAHACVRTSVHTCIHTHVRTYVRTYSFILLTEK